MPELPSLTTRPILQGLIILSVLLSGWLFYIVTGSIFESDLEKGFVIITFGTIIVGVIYSLNLLTSRYLTNFLMKVLSISPKKRREYEYNIGYALHMLIGFSSIFIFLFYYTAGQNLIFIFNNNLLLRISLFIIFVFFMSIIYYIFRNSNLLYLKTDEKTCDVLAMGPFTNMDFIFNIVWRIFVQKPFFIRSYTNSTNSNLLYLKTDFDYNMENEKKIYLDFKAKETKITEKARLKAIDDYKKSKNSKRRNKK